MQSQHRYSPRAICESCIDGGRGQHPIEYNAHNWLAFRLNGGNRYECLGDEGYFERNCISGYSGEGERDVCVAGLRARYNKSRKYFEKHGFLVNPYYPEYEGKPNRENLLDDIGGGFWYGNWTEGADIPKAFQLSLPPAGTKLADLDELPDDGIKITYNGNPFHYIANVAGYNYCAGGADAIILMYEPVSRTVLFTFDYS